MEFQEIGALWVKRDRNGNTMLTGTLKTKGGDVPVFIFKNTRKPQGSNQPDYRIYIQKR